MQESEVKSWQKLLFSETLVTKNKSHKIAYIAVFVAFNVVVNAFSIPLGFMQLSLTMFVSILTGIILGPIFGFSACFLGDTIGFFMNSGGNVWTPWVGLSMGMAALIGAFIVNGIPWKFKGAWCVKLVLVCLLTFLICTFAINTTAGYFLWNSKGLSYWVFVGARLSGQIWNSIFNYILLFIAVPVVQRLKIY